MLLLAPALLLACEDPAVTPSEPARLHLSPGDVDLGEVALHDHADATLTLTNTGEQSLDLYEARIVDDRLRALFTLGTPSATQLEPGQQAEVEIAFSARLVGPIEAELEVVSALGVSPPVPLRATVRGVPALRVQPSALDFGELDVGQTAVLDLRLSNVGNDALQLGSVDIGGLGDGAFAVVIDPAGGRLGPGDDDGLLSISFTPPRSGSYSEVFVLSSNDPEAPQRAVSASGSAR